MSDVHRNITACSNSAVVESSPCAAAPIFAAIASAGFTNVRPVDLSAIDDAEGHLEQNTGGYALAALRQ